MVKSLKIFGLALVAQVSWAAVRFPTDGNLTESVQKEDVAAHIKLPLKVEVRALAQVAADRIYLQDVATCSGAQYACAEILGMDVDESAQPGRTKIISLDRVKHLLTQEFPRFQLQVEGPAMVRVESKHIEVGAPEVESALQAVISSRLKENKSLRLRSLNVQMPRPLKAWPGEYRLMFPVVQDAQIQHLDWVVEHLLGDKSWSLIYQPAGVSANRRSLHRLTVHLELEIQLPVARTHIARGSLLKHSDFEYQWTRLGRQSLGMVHEIKNVVGLLSKQAVRSGQPVSFRMLEVPEVVARGEKVKMHIKRAGLNVSAEGKALKAGGIGQTIAVYYPATKKTVQGKILESGVVEVQL